MTDIVLSLGVKVSIGGNVYDVVSASEVIDGDMGSGTVTRKKMLRIRSKSGLELVVMHEQEE